MSPENGPAQEPDVSRRGKDQEMLGQESTDTIVTPAELLTCAEETLRKAGVPDPKTDARALLFHCFDLTLTKYLLEKNTKLPEEYARNGRLAQFEKAIEKRKQRIPLQHILGQAPFMGYLFEVNEHVLIPRADTEILVETGLELIRMLREEKQEESQEEQVLDLCTGSGCIAVSLKKLEPSISCTASDVSAQALAVARRNAARLAAPVRFVCSNLFAAFARTEKFDLIVSNPPYIATEEIGALQEEVSGHDPFLALDGGEDGLFFYRKICALSPRHLKRGGFLAVEIGAEQGQEVKRLMKSAGFTDVVIRKDLGGLDRVVCGQYLK